MSKKILISKEEKDRILGLHNKIQESSDSSDSRGTYVAPLRIGLRMFDKNSRYIRNKRKWIQITSN